ncbi:GntR family transcriptional regulator [Plantactinospora sp. WMMB782]|uniref:GntR family transcriptional regulator n=1 Tax=Plantactinospora sp. WMMB782 TaxID=3404121 RepID=UPI003B93079E
MIVPGGPRIDTAAKLTALLREQIMSGQLAPGALIPSEQTLRQTYGLARGTVAKAVRALRNEGLATHVVGYGVVVRPVGEKEDVPAGPGSTVDIRMPSPAEVEAWELPEGVPVFVVVDADGTGQVYPADRYRLRVG